MVSGSSALAASSRHQIYVIFLVTWAASVIGDTGLLLEARLGAGKVRGWLDRWKYSHRVDQAQHKLQRNAFSAVVTGRLVPGGRAPVIIALGLSRFPVRRFILFDTAACGMWAAIYSTIGSVGGRIAKHPILGMALAIAFAVVVSFLVQISIRLVQRLRRRRALPMEQESLTSGARQQRGDDARTDGQRNRATSDQPADERAARGAHKAELHADPQREVR